MQVLTLTPKEAFLKYLLEHDAGYYYVHMDKAKWKTVVLTMIEKIDAHLLSQVKDVDLLKYALWIVVAESLYAFEVCECLVDVKRYLDKDNIDPYLDWENVSQVVSSLSRKIERKKRKKPGWE